MQLSSLKRIQWKGLQLHINFMMYVQCMYNNILLTDTSYEIRSYIVYITDLLYM